MSKSKFDKTEETFRILQAALQQPFPFNENYRLASSRDRDDVKQLLIFAEKEGATCADVRLWYANGTEHQDRPGVLGSFHPLIHKTEEGWAWIIDTAEKLAKDLKRWIWVTLGEDRWVRIIVGEDPQEEQDDDNPTGALYVDGKYQNDQYITTFSPEGKEHFVGCS
jgi:hypothetical protein